MIRRRNHCFHVAPIFPTVNVNRNRCWVYCNVKHLLLIQISLYYGFWVQSFVRSQSMCAYAFLCIHILTRIHSQMNSVVAVKLNRLKRVRMVAFHSSCTPQHCYWLLRDTHGMKVKKTNRPPSMHPAVSGAAWQIWFEFFMLPVDGLLLIVKACFYFSFRHFIVNLFW